MIKNNKIHLMNLMNYFGIVSIGIFSILGASLFFTTHSQNGGKGKKIKPLIVLEDQNRPSLNYDGSRVVAGPEVGLSQVFDVDSGIKLGSYKIKDSLDQAISADGKKVRIFGGGYYTTYEIDTGKVISQGKTTIYQNGKRAGAVNVVSYGGQTSRNITSDLSLVTQPYRRMYGEEFSPEQPAVTLGRLEDNSLVKEFRTDDGYLKKDNWDYTEITPDGKFIMASRYKFEDATRSRTVIWNVETGKIIFSKPQSSHWLSLSADGKRLVTKDGKEGGKIECWDVASGKRISVLTEKAAGREVRVSRSVISPDGKILVTTGNEEFYFWDVETGRVIAAQDQSEYNEGMVKSAAFSGDGKRIAIGSDVEVVTVWSVDEILKNEKQTVVAE